MGSTTINLHKAIIIGPISSRIVKKYPRLNQHAGAMVTKGMSRQSVFLGEYNWFPLIF